MLRNVDLNETIQSKAPLKAWLFIGILLTMGPVFGFAATLFGMTGAYYHLKTTGGEMVNPANLEETIIWSQYSTIIGLAVCPFGVGMILYAVINMRRIDRSEQSPN